jgi:hypothetical protein
MPVSRPGPRRRTAASAAGPALAIESSAALVCFASFSIWVATCCRISARDAETALIAAFRSATAPFSWEAVTASLFPRVSPPSP